MNSHYFFLANLCLACAASHADTSQPLSAPAPRPTASGAPAAEVEHETITVEGQRTHSTAAPTDVTGLGRTTKSAEEIAKKQVQGIRDLTRYDPGIAVNEQGQGASAGYSMRGVDKDRVSILVDGIAQGQSLGVEYGLFNGFRGGSKNEVEYENIRAVDFQEGAGSVLAGNGALGGAVMLRTKEPQDLLRDGERFAAHVKTGYSSKNDGGMGSLGLAFRTQAWQGLLIHTRRQTKETRSHGDVEGQRMPRYICDPSCSLRHVWVEPGDVTGPTRSVANPMDLQSESTLAKLSLLPGQGHEIGIVAERTVQAYHMLDTGRNAYYRSNREVGSSSERPPSTAQWTHYWYGNNDHEKTRAGLFYQYRAPDPANAWLDALRIEADREQIDMTTVWGMKGCSKGLNLGCIPNREGQRSLRNDNIFASSLTRLALQAEKALLWPGQAHLLRAQAGWDQGRSTIRDVTQVRGIGFLGATGSLGPLGIYHQTRPDPALGNRDGDERKEPIDGRHAYLAFSDDVHLGEKWSVTAGVRVDQHRFRSRTPSFQGSSLTYTVPSLLLGVAYHFNDAWQLSYKHSTGYRVPGIQQLYGASTFRNDAHQQPLRHEHATNHEVGLTWQRPVARLHASVFHSRYKDLISLFLAKASENIVYRNAQAAATWGYKLTADVDLNALASAAPKGLFARAAYGKVRPWGRGTHPDDGSNILIANHAMDSIQPAKLVVGLDYEPADKPWSLGLAYTYSAPKRAQELQVLSRHPLGGIVDTQVVDRVSPSWQTLDLQAGWRISRDTTLRLLVGNLLNAKYTTWESMRQTGLAGVSSGVVINNLSETGYQRLTAPGRHWQLTLESRF